MKCIEPNCGAEYEPRELQVEMGKFLGRRHPMPGLCPTHREAALEAQEQAEHAAEASRQAAIAPKRRGWRETCGIPSFFMNKDFSTFEQDRQPGAYKKTWDYAEGFNCEQPRGYPWMVLASFVAPPKSGQRKDKGDANGLGKTHLACSIAHRVLDNWKGQEVRRPVYFISEPEYIESLQATYSMSYEDRAMRESEHDITQRLSVEPLLILDDIGKVIRSPKDNPDKTALTTLFVQEKLFALFDKRYRLGLPMVVTTNLSSDDLQRYLGTASMDRLIEMSGGRYTRLIGESYRRLG